MSTTSARTVIADSLYSHLYTCDQSSDPCYQNTPAGDESWADLAQRRAEHVARLVDAAVVLPA